MIRLGNSKICRMMMVMIILMGMVGWSGGFGQNTTLIPEHSVWKYNDSGVFPGSNWNLPDFNDQTWSEGPAQLGYGDGDEQTILNYGTDASNKYITYYFRKSFNVADADNYQRLLIKLLRDDGAVVYLNGIQIVSTNMPDQVGPETMAVIAVGGDEESTYLPFYVDADALITGVNIIAVEVHQQSPTSSDISFDLELAASSHALNPMVINEISPRNYSYFPDDKNQFTDWIELLNSGYEPVDLGGYTLSDNLAKPKKWTFPSGTVINPGAYLLVYADGTNAGLHTNFHLSGSGEFLALYNDSGDVVDSLHYPSVPPNNSYGRLQDGEDTLGWFGFPTPGATNQGGVTTGELPPKPVFSKKAGLYAGSVELELTADDPNVTIRYTRNGSDPDIFSDRYTGPLTVSYSSVIKARCFKDNQLPGKVVTQSYLIDENFNIPVISIAIDDRFLSDESMGIYLDDRLTERKEWKRPAVLQFFEPDGTGFTSRVDLRLFGRGAVRFSQKSLSVFVRPDENGLDGLNYRLFPDSPITYYQSFVLRSSSDDWRETMFRDGFEQSLIEGKTDLDLQNYRPSVVFINGSYMGIHNIREKYNEQYLLAHHQVDPDQTDLLYVDNDFYPPRIEVKSGDDAAYWAMWNFVTANDMTDPDNYAQAGSMIDLNNYLDYVSIEILTANRSWLHNRRVWRTKTPDGKFKYTVSDLDYGYTFLDQNVLSSLNSVDLVFKSLVKNHDFKKRLLNRLTVLSETVFEKNRALHMIDSMANMIDPYIARHIERWEGTFTGTLTSKADWENKVEEMRDFARQRATVQQNYMKDFFNTSSTIDLSISVAPPNAGQVFSNDRLLTDQTYSGHPFQGAPFKLSAKAYPGYLFQGWEIDGTPDINPDSELNLSGDDDYTITALFIPQREGDLVISEIYYAPPPNTGESYEYIELTNAGRSKVNLNGYYFSGIACTFQDNVWLNTGETVLVTAENSNYSFVRGPVYQWSSGDLNNSGEELILYQPDGTVADRVNYATTSPWPVSVPESGYSIALDNIQSDNNEGNNWVKSQYLGGSPGAPNPVGIYKDIRINELSALPGKQGYWGSTDWIELVNTGSVTVDLAGYYLSDTPDNMLKYRIPDGFPNLTNLDPGEHILFLASATPEVGPLNTNFKLNADHGAVVLSKNAGDWVQMIDRVDYNYLNQGESMGRLPDATGDFITFNYPTPGEVNHLVDANIVAPAQVISGEWMPVLVTITDANGNIDRKVNEAFNLSVTSGSLSDREIRIRNGRGSLVTQVTADHDFNISIDGYPYSRYVQVVDSRPKVYLSGTMEKSLILASGVDYRITGDLTIVDTANLIIQAGAKLIFNKAKNIISYGRIAMEGTLAEPIVIMPRVSDSIWGGVEIHNVDSTSTFEWVMMFHGGGDGRRTYGHGRSQPLIFADHAVMDMNHVTLTDNNGSGIYAEYSDFNINNLLIARSRLGMELRYCTSETRNSWFIELPDNDWSTTGDDADAVYYWSVKDFTKPHILDNCVIYKTEDDGIDHWRSYSKISNCLISRMYDKGISTGYGSQVTVIRSVFARDQRGVSPSFGSHVKIYQSDFYNCNIPLWAYNYSSGELHNCVLANHSTDYNDHGYPTWYFNHCISDSDPALPGKSNLYGSIGMTDPSQWDFTLSAGSPAIDTGDPEMERDPDGSVADIGAFPYIPGGAGELVINEIYYHPPASQGLESQYEFIELINASGQTLDVGNYRLTNAVDFVFPENIIVDPGGLILVVSDPVTYKDLGVPVFAWKSTGKLSNKGESIQLINQRGELIDEVTYKDSNPWPAQADGLGYSLSLTDPYSDNSNPDNWLPSYIYGGTPGRKNLQPDWSKLKINETFRAAANSIGQTSTDNSWLEIYNGTDASINIGGLFISDDSADPGKWQINRTHPDKTQVQAKSFVLLKFVENPGTSSPLLLPDTLVKSQGPVILSRLNWDGTYTRIDNVTFDPTENTHSTGRYPDGASNILDFSSPSPGAPNAVGATHMISMRQMKAGDYLPVVVRLKAGEQINPDAVNETVSLQADGAALDHNQIALVRGVGSITTKVSGNGDFVLNLPQWDDSLRVKITSFRPMKCNFDPIEYDEIWTGEKDVVIDRDFEISIGRTITIMPGTRVLIAEDANIEVLGAIKAMGTPGNPIIFMPLSWDSQWGGIQFGSYAGASEFNNCFFVGGAGDKSVHLGHSESQAVISSSGAQITLNNCFFLDNSGKAVYGQHAVLKFDGTIISRCDAGIESYDGNVSLDNSAILFIPNEAQTISGDKEHDGFYIYKSQGSDGSTARITHSLIGFVTDDAVDMLPETHVDASWLTLTGTGDKGISILGSSLVADHLVVYKCAKGIAAKEASNVTIDQSTFYRNNYALQAYSNNPSIGYAFLSLSNSILSSSVANDFYQEDGSTLTVSYSLSDAQLPAGTGNLFGDPQFTDPVNGDFTLQPASPAINQGDPAHLPDPDGSRVDMGAYHYNYGSINNLIISEIHYHPKDIFTDYEFVELYNPSVATIDIGNYSVTGSVSFTFPAGTELLPLSYIIIAKDAIIFQNQGFPVYQWDSGGSLPDAGGTVEITTGTGIILDQVNYQAGGYWPSWPAGGGPSLELINPERDNGSGTSWRSSHYINGTPGHPNLTAPQEGIVINEVLARNGTTYPDEYGNYVDWVELYNTSYHFVDLSGLFLSKYADNPGRFEIPASGPDSMLIAPGGYFVFWLDEHPERGLHHASFLIPGDGSWIGLSKFNDQSFTVMDSLTYPPITTDLSYGRTPDGGQDFEIFGSPTPNAPNRVPRSKINGLYINELMARNSSTYLNNINEYDDWLELYNSTDQPIDVGGLYLSDHRNNLVLWQIPETHPDSTTISPKGFMVFYPTTKIHDGIRHVDFQLAGTGEFVALSQHVQGEIVILDSVTYPAITSDLSYGRVQDGAPSWMIFNNPTPDSSNNEASGIDDPVRTNVDISVYPNPVKEHLTILIDPGREHLKQVEIRDLQGRVIVKWLITKPASGNRLRLFWDPISGGDQKPGLVFVIVVTDQSVHFQRVMIND